ncbi:MAG TPA: PhnD/SsuA/transferrin family substrate-binding protein [Acidimicrobiia bacterium]
MKIPVYRLMSGVQNALLSAMLDDVGERIGVAWDYRTGLGDDGLAYLCGLPALDLLGTHAPLAGPVLSSARYGGQPCYFADVLVRRDDRRGLGERTGGTWAFNERGSFSGWVAVMAGLESRSIHRTIFDWVESGSHARSIEMVGSGAADLCGIDSHICDLATADELRGMQVIDSFGPWPVPPLLVSRTLDKGVVHLLREAIGKVRSANARVAGWALIEDSHLDPIASVVRILRERSVLP